jgi:hypothetical protein
VAPIVALVTLGCAAAPRQRPEDMHPATPSGEDRRAVDEAEAAMRRADDELTAARAATAPDCPRACGLAANVCALAERICVIAARYPAEDPVARRCADGRARCARARAAVVPTCGCDPQPVR